MKRAAARAAAVLITIAVLAGTAAAQSVEYEPEQDQFQTDMDFFIEQLPPDEDFEIIRNGGSLDGIPIQQFSSDLQGRAQFTAGVSPEDNGVNHILGAGWDYTLQFQNDTFVDNVTLYWGFDYHALDTFFDGEIQHDLLDEALGTPQGNLIELPDDAGTLYAFRNTVSAGVGLSPEMSRDTAVFINSSNRELLSDNDPGDTFMIFRFRNETDQVVADLEAPMSATNIQETVESDHLNPILFFAYVNTSTGTPSDEAQLYNITNGEITRVDEATVPSEGMEDWEIAIGYNRGSATGGVNVSYAEYAAIPVRSIEAYTTPATFGSGNALYVWPDYSFESTAPVGFEWNDGEGFESFFDDLETSKTLETRNTENGTVLDYRVDIDQQDALRHLFPLSGQVGTVTEFVLTGPSPGSDEKNFTVQYLVPSEYQAGELQLIIEDSAGNTIVTSATEGGATDLDGDCVESGAIVTSDCIGHRIRFDFVEDTPEPGEAEVRYRYVNQEASDPDIEGDVFETEPVTVTFLASFKEITAISPSEGVTITTLFPTFIFDLITRVDGEASLLIDSSTQKQWSVGAGFSGQLEHTPISGLSEGAHTWSAQFAGEDGDTVSTETRNFTINTSLAPRVNFTLHEPVGGVTVTDKDVTLRYSVEVSEPGNLTTVLDDEVIETQQLASGTFDNLTSQVLQIPLGDHSWRLRFDDGTHVFESSPETFIAAERINISLLEPQDGDTVDTLPMIFEADVNVGEAGEVGILINGNPIDETESVEEGFNGTVQIETSDVPTGKHTARVFFDSDRTGDRYTSAATTFTLLEGAEEDVSGGELGQAIVTGGAALMGLSPGASLALASIIVSIMLGMLLGSVVRSGIVAGIGVVLGVIGFTVAQWFPRWGAVVFTVIAGYLVAREASSGRR